MSKNIEYEDAYVIEERPFVNRQTDDIDLEELKENLSLDSLTLSTDEMEITEDFDRLKIQTETTKKKLDLVDINKIKIAEFQPKIVKREEVVEDFIRNFLNKFGFNKTLDEFNKEFNELSKKGKFNDNNIGPVTDVNIKNAKLMEKKTRMTSELEKAKKNAELAKKERDFHKEFYLKTKGEKELISNDIKTLQELHTEFQSKIDDLNKKYQQICKSKSLMELDVRKLDSDCKKKALLVDQLQNEINKLDNTTKKELLEPKDKPLKMPKPQIKEGELTPWPKDIRNNIFLLHNYASFTPTPGLQKTIKAHEKPIGCISVHIKKNVVATGCDDASFKIFSMGSFEELVSGVGHKDYVSGVDIHPKASFVATVSGDRTIKLWDLSTIKVKATFTDHKSIVWSTKFHDTGDFLLSCSDDSSIKLWDINALKCRNNFRGHSDSVNKITFQPFTNYFASCSSDKTISIWDMREGQTVQTFYGHLNSINDVSFNSRGDVLYSCDADGIIKIWDIRKISEMNTFSSFPGVSANCLEADKSSSVLFVGYDNGHLGIVNLLKNEIGPVVKAHESSINGLGINLTNTYLYTVGSDGYLNIWQ